MSNPKLAYRHQLSLDNSVKIDKVTHGNFTPDGFTWTSSDINKATVSATGLVTRVLTTDTGSVTITVTGFFFDKTVADPDQAARPFRSSLTFDLVPLANLIPELQTVPIHYTVPK